MTTNATAPATEGDSHGGLGAGGGDDAACSARTANGTRGHRRRQATARQLDVLRAIVVFRAEHHGISPTLRELMDLVSVGSTQGVRDHLDALERKGLVIRPMGAGVSRGVVPTQAGFDAAGGA